MICNDCGTWHRFAARHCPWCLPLPPPMRGLGQNFMVRLLTAKDDRTEQVTRFHDSRPLLQDAARDRLIDTRVD